MSKTIFRSPRAIASRAALAFCIVLCGVSRTFADELPPLPPGAKPTDCVVLSMARTYGDDPAIAANTPTSVTIDGAVAPVAERGGIVIPHTGYSDSTATITYTLPNAAPGVYDVWTAFSLGGVARQSFRFSVGERGKTGVARASWAQSNEVSWESVWRKAPVSLTLFSQDRSLVLDESGHASGRKILTAVALVRRQALPAGMSDQGGAVRANVAAWSPENPKRRYYVLESDSAAPADRLYSALANLPAALKARARVDAYYGDEARAIADRASTPPLPCVIAMDGAFGVLGIASAKDGDAQIARAVTATAPDGALAGRTASGTAPAATSLTAGVPRSWLVAGTWAGLGGLSLYGPGAEAVARPSLGDPVVVERFDTSLPSHWRESPTADGVAAIDASSDDFVWSRGSAYACVYLKADRPRTVTLHLAQTGIGTLAWLDGQPLVVAADTSSARCSLPHASGESAASGTTDQGNRIAVQATRPEEPVCAQVALTAGWHRLLVKLVMRHAKGETFAFASRFTEADGTAATGIAASLSDPSAPSALHAEAARIQPLVMTDAPFNLAYPDRPIRLNIALRRLASADESEPITPLLPFRATLRVTVRDYSGGEVASSRQAGVFPTDVAVSLPKPLPTGYYSVETALLAPDGSLIAAYPPDGFSVIRGTKAQTARAADKKLATTYYFMDDGKADSLYFPYMERLGIRRNVGGNPGPATDLYADAAKRGLHLAGELWDYSDPAKVAETAKLDAPYADAFKSYNEVDIVPRIRGTAQHWTEITKLHYDAVKAASPNATVLSASLARPGADSWFHDCLALGMDKYVDAWDVHCYPQTPPLLEGTMSNSPNETELGVLKAYRELGQTNTKPFWIGETGARSSHGMDARRWQAGTVAKMIACANSRKDFVKIGFLVPWWYSRAQSRMGDIEAAHMPAEASYYTAGALIDGFPYTKLDLGAGVQAARFGSTTMLWRTDPGGAVSLDLATGKRWVIVNVVGSATPLAVAANGKAAVSVTDSPVYVLTADDYARLTAY